MAADAWIEAARAWAPGPEWLAPGPRLFAAPQDRHAWLEGVRALLTAQPGLRADLQTQAQPRPVRAAPSGWVEAGQWTAALPAAALLALVDGDPARLDPVRGRVHEALALSEWVPPHHQHSRPLDLSAAGVVGHLALYLDFARELLPATERRSVAEAIGRRGVDAFVTMCRERRAFWTTARHNWPTVIAGEIGLGLLAAWEAVGEPQAALGHVVERIATPLLTYPEDGSYEEGPGYWHYGIGECLPVCRALFLATAGAVDLFTLPFLRHTGDYALHVRTPEGGCFEVEDASRQWAAGWMLAVLGGRFDRPDWTAAAAAAAGTAAGGPALRQAFFCGRVVAAPTAARETMAFFPGTQNAMLRADWGRAAFFAGLHAGSNTVNHAHLDLGTFTVVAGGERVLGDSGSWAYTLDYFQSRPGGRRWDYEPNTTAGHNALLVDGAGQDPAPTANCRFHQIELRPEDGLALLAVDLTAAYGGRLSRYVRHFVYFAEGLLLVIDDVASDLERRLAWCGHPGGVPEALPEGVPGWRWQVGGATAELRLLCLRDEDGFVLSEARRATRYLDRVGHPHTYTTHAVRAATLHPTKAWTVVAALVAGASGALPAMRVEAAGAEGLAVTTGTRRGRVAWGGGHVVWTAANGQGPLG